MESPRVEPIKNGWAARGEGWAVHAPTRQEALERFRVAKERHEVIEKRSVAPIR